MRDPGRPLSQDACSKHDEYGSYDMSKHVSMNGSEYARFHNIRSDMLTAIRVECQGKDPRAHRPMAR